MLKICQNYAGVIPKICPSIIYSVIKTGLGLCHSTQSQRASQLRMLGDYLKNCPGPGPLGLKRHTENIGRDNAAARVNG